MKISTLAVALVIFLLVSDSEEVWIKRPNEYRRRPGSWIKRRPERYRRPRYYRRPRVLYKRDAESPCPPTADDDDDNDDGMDKEAAVNLLKKLELECPQFAIDPSVGLSKAVVIQAFDAVDDDKDDNLDDKELDEFEEVLDAFKVCEEAAGAKD